MVDVKLGTTKSSRGSKGKNALVIYETGKVQSNQIEFIFNLYRVKKEIKNVSIDCALEQKEDRLVLLVSGLFAESWMHIKNMLGQLNDSINLSK